MKITVYVPDDLHARIKALPDGKLNVSAVCQEALKAAVERREDSDLARAVRAWIRRNEDLVVACVVGIVPDELDAPNTTDLDAALDAAAREG